MDAEELAHLKRQRDGYELKLQQFAVTLQEKDKEIRKCNDLVLQSSMREKELEIKLQLQEKIAATAAAMRWSADVQTSQNALQRAAMEDFQLRLSEGMAQLSSKNQGATLSQQLEQLNKSVLEIQSLKVTLGETQKELCRRDAELQCFRDEFVRCVKFGCPPSHRETQRSDHKSIPRAPPTIPEWQVQPPSANKNGIICRSYRRESASDSTATP